MSCRATDCLSQAKVPSKPNQRYLSSPRVHYDLPEPGNRQEFGVCVKGLSHTEDISVKYTAIQYILSKSLPSILGLTLSIL